jgi:hypothetical protein
MGKANAPGPPNNSPTKADTSSANRGSACRMAAASTDQRRCVSQVRTGGPVRTTGRTTAMLAISETNQIIQRREVNTPVCAKCTPVARVAPGSGGDRADREDVQHRQGGAQLLVGLAQPRQQQPRHQHLGEVDAREPERVRQLAAGEQVGGQEAQQRADPAGRRGQLGAPHEQAHEQRVDGPHRRQEAGRAREDASQCRDEDHHPRPARW